MMKQHQRIGLFSAVAFAAMWIMLGGVRAHSHTVEATDVVDPVKNPRATEQISLSGSTESGTIWGQDPLEKLTQLVTEGYRRAVSFLEEARMAFDTAARAEKVTKLRKSWEAWERSLGEVARGLEVATVAFPEPGKTFRACADLPGVLAYVMEGESTIYVCARALEPPYDAQGLGQILVHEAAHVAGIYDECGATHIEVQTMIRTRAGLQFKNGYWDRCGLTAASSRPAASAESLAIEP